MKDGNFFETESFEAEFGSEPEGERGRVRPSPRPFRGGGGAPRPRFPGSTPRVRSPAPQFAGPARRGSAPRFPAPSPRAMRRPLPYPRPVYGGYPYGYPIFAGPPVIEAAPSTPEQAQCVQECLSRRAALAGAAGPFAPEPFPAAPSAGDASAGDSSAAEPSSTEPAQQSEFGASHAKPCGCQRCRPLSEEQEIELALELLNVSSEAELDQFLGKIWKGIKKVGSAIGKVAKPFAGVLKAVAKKALPFVGGALGSFIPIPGVGTALGSALGSAVSKALELEMEGMSYEDRELEMARRFVRIASTAAQRVGQIAPGQSPEAAVRSAVIDAARTHLPGADLSRFGVPAGADARSSGASGSWRRQGHQITLFGV